MKNKEVVAKLIEYYMNKDKKTICRVLANFMIDFNRIQNIDSLPIDEFIRLSNRLDKNYKSLHEWIKNGFPDDELILEIFKEND